MEPKGVAWKDEALLPSASGRPKAAPASSTMRGSPGASRRSPCTTKHEPARAAFSSAASRSASARERLQCNTTRAPSRCSARAIAAPMRRAAPVIRTAPSRMLYSPALEKRFSQCSPRLSDARRTDSASPRTGGGEPLPAACRTHRELHPRRRRLDPVLALHGAGALCAGPRLLRRRGAQVRRGGRLRHLSRDLADVREVLRAAGGGGPV